MKSILSIIVLITSFTGFGQRIFNGKVAAKDNEPIPYANLSVPGTFYGTATNLEGEFSLKLPEGLTKDSISPVWDSSPNVWRSLTWEKKYILFWKITLRT